MRRAIIDFTKNWSRPRLPRCEGTVAQLSPREMATLRALYRLVVDDQEVADATIDTLLQQRIARDRGYTLVYRSGAALVEAAAKEAGDVCFTALEPPAQSRALALLLQEYVHPDLEPSCKRRLRLSAHALEQLLGSATKKRLRTHVVRDFLDHYYAGKRGWELVGHKSYPGSPEEELPEVAVEKVEPRRHSVTMHLSDGTVEAWTLEDFAEQAASGIPERVPVKSGRQLATLDARLREQWQRAASASRRPQSGKSRRPTAFDCVIVGSGPVGAAAADVLVRLGMTVAMLESGDQPERDRFKVMERSLDNSVAWDFAPWEYEMHGDDLDLNTFAVRKVGGSSLAWGAVCPRFLENDFRLQSRYGVGMDWPVDYRDLAPDYLAAERFMGVSGHDDNPFLPAREAPFPMEGFAMSDSDLLVKGACDRLGIRLHSIPTARNTRTYQGRSKCLNYSLCRACPVGAMYSSDQTIDRLREFDHFHLLTRAHARKVLTGAGGRVEAVRYHDAEGREHTLRADHVILAAQAVENVRILLSSRNDRYPQGVANSSGLLGKFLTEHLKFYLMGRVPQKLHPHVRGYETAASQQFQDHARRDRYAGGRIIVRENAGPVPLDLALRSGKWGASLKAEMSAAFGSFVTLGAFMEQLPYADNRIDLSPTAKNAFGDPAARIHFQLMRGYEKRGYHKMKGILERIFRELEATGVREIMPPSVGGHYMCCHRMGRSLKDSVVDSYCEAHDVQNLFLAGSGSFTTGGVSNPTLTGVALALRTARRIAERATQRATAPAVRELAAAAQD